MITTLSKQNSTNALIREWLVRVHLRELLRSGRTSTLSAQITTSEVFSEALHTDPDLARKAQLELWLSIQTAVDLSLFFTALRFIWAFVLSLVTADFRTLARLRDKIKSLNLPIELIPQSLRPIELAA